MDVPDGADLARAHAGTHFLKERIEAEVEVRAVNEPGSFAELRELGRFVGSERERLLAHNVLPRSEHQLHLRVVELVRRRDVHDVDPLVAE